MASATNINGFNIGGNNNSFDQRGHFYRAFLDGNVSGMAVKQNSTPNMTVLVEHGSALLNKNTISASIAEIKSNTSVAIDTANTANPRIDSVVIYEDTSVAIPTVEANYWQDGAGGRFKIVSLPGTAAASPVALTDASIQSAIGAGKPWARLADITVPANSTTIINSNIADKRNVISPKVSNYGTAGVLMADESGNVAVTTLPYKVILADTSSGANSATYKTFTLNDLVVGGYYIVYHQGPTMGQSGNSPGTFSTTINVSDVGVIATQANVTSTSTGQNPVHNLTGFFIASSTSHTVTFKITTNNVSLALADRSQRTLVARMVGINGA